MNDLVLCLIDFGVLYLIIVVFKFLMVPSGPPIYIDGWTPTPR